MHRICCFCEKWESGGIEGFLCNALTHMDRSNLQIEIVAVCRGESVFTSRLAEIGIPVIELSSTLRTPKNAHLFRQLLAEKKYDAIHFNLFHGLSFHYVQVAKQAGIPIRIIHSHGCGLRKSFTRPLKMFLHYLGRFLWMNSATHLLACSTAAARFLFGGRSIHARTVPNGIEADRFRFSDEDRSATRQKLGWSDETVLGTVGRLSSEKNQAFLLDVFAEYCKLVPRSRLLLVGDGPERGNLEKKAISLGIADKTLFYGATDRVAPLLSVMDVFVLPSLFEGFGIAAIEAQANGLPLLCSDGVPPETCLNTHHVRLSLKAGASRWARAAIHLSASVSRGDGPTAVHSAGFDAESSARLIEEIYRETTL